MSRKITQPIGQVRLTNVAVVRYNKGGKRFEIACYRNKIMDYRSGLEKDLSEVLQTDRIFTNVSKGEFAKSADLEKVFGTRDEEEIAKIILEKGNSLQVSDLERNQQLQNTLSQIATWVASNCVHPETNRPYTVSQIKHALEHNYTVQTHKPIKKQYLDAVKFLKTVIPIERAKMELSLQYPACNDATVQEALDKLPHVLSSEHKTKDPYSVLIQVDPSLYRELDDLAKKVKGRLEIVQHVVTQQGDVDLEKEIERKKQPQQQKDGPPNVHENMSSDDEAAPLAEKLEAVRLHAAEAHQQDDSNSSDDDSDKMPQPPTRKNQRKAQKKSKKAKRRDREEVAERKARLDIERQKQEERLETSMQTEAARANAAAQQQDGPTSCNTCGGSFANAAEYRAHFRSDWHRFNQKLKLKGIPPVSEQEVSESI